MVDPEDPDDMLQLTRGILTTIVSSDPDSTQPQIDRHILSEHIVVEDEILDRLVECLDNHAPCPLECDNSENGCVIRLRRKDTISDFVGGLNEDNRNPLRLS